MDNRKLIPYPKQLGLINGLPRPSSPPIPDSLCLTTDGCFNTVINRYCTATNAHILFLLYLCWSGKIDLAWLRDILQNISTRLNDGVRKWTQHGKRPVSAHASVLADLHDPVSAFGCRRAHRPFPFVPFCHSLFLLTVTDKTVRCWCWHVHAPCSLLADWDRAVPDTHPVI